MENYARVSIETHLFFARIMKEHSLFLEAGFPCKDTSFIMQAEFFRQRFEELLLRVVRIGNGMVSDSVINSQELVTQFTLPAENTTSRLTGIPIDSQITVLEQNLQSGQEWDRNPSLIRQINRINEESLRLLDGLIAFKESILTGVREGQLFTANYPLLIQHILREAKLYRATIRELFHHRRITPQRMRAQEDFWNQIMMEHAQFIRGLLDPSEAQLIVTANDFAMDYAELLETARTRDLRANEGLTRKSLTETLKYREFKTAGAEGILTRQIQSIILPLLADHVLREANHYIRILEQSIREEER